MKYKVGDRFRYKDLYETFEIIRCDEELGQYVAVEVKEVGSRIFNEWEEKNMVLEVLVDSSTKKPKLIDILNKIANGDLKEGTKVKHDGSVYEYSEGNLWLSVGDTQGTVSIDISRANDEVELIEPQEPTDNTKIEELNPNNYLNFVDYDKDDNEGYKLDANLAIMGDCSRGIKGIISKLNEVIRKINKENNNE